MSTPKSPKFARPVQFCAEPVDGDATCHRLPMHKGDHSPFVRGNGIPAPKAAKATMSRKGSAKPKTRVIGGVTYRLVAVRQPQADEVVEAVPAPSKAASKRPNRKASPAKPASRKVRVIPEAKSRRRVASSTGR